MRQMEVLNQNPPVSRKGKCTWLIAVTLCQLYVSIVRVSADTDCPVNTRTLVAYPEEDSYDFEYTFDPLIKTNIDLIDRLLTSGDDVVCDWTVRAREGHTATVEFKTFHLSPSSGSKDADCMKLYDGQSSEGKLLGEVCGGEEPDETYKASGRYMYIVFEQGEVTGHRSFSISYRADPEPKELLLKIAGTVCGVVAAIAVVFLAFKFSNNCRPCRKQCCPDEATEVDTTHRELRPLSPAVLVPASVTNSDRQNNSPGSADPGSRGRPHNLVLSTEEGEEDGGELSPSADEPPPSYNSIFGELDEQNNVSKPN